MNSFNVSGKRSQKPFVVWFTGLPCSGKSTLADGLYQYLEGEGYSAERLDGDSVRAIFPQTGFTKEERDAHIKRVGYLSSMLEKHGVIVISSFVSPYREARDFVKNLCSNFIEVYVSTSVEDCEKRDIKGMYKKARAGEIANFTGVNDPYEVPENPALSVDAGSLSVEESLEEIKKALKQYL